MRSARTRVQGTTSAATLLACSIGLTLTGTTGCLCVGGGALSRAACARAARQCGLLTCGVFLMAPLLQTLTLSVSSDTVVATSCWLLALHLFLNNYDFVHGVTDTLSGSLSLGAALGASVLMASRLEQPLQVFAQVLFSLQLYLMAPYARRYIKQASGPGHYMTTGAMAVGGGLMLVPISRLSLLAYVLVLLCVAFVCPWWLVRAQKFKAQINGPWDEAVPKVNLTVAS